MKSFREHISIKSTEINELKIDSKSYQKFSTEAIKNINLMIEYGRKTVGLDNKQLNSLFDAVKNIHAGEDAIRISLEPKEDEEKKKGDKQW